VTGGPELPQGKGGSAKKQVDLEAFIKSLENELKAQGKEEQRAPSPPQQKRKSSILDFMSAEAQGKGPSEAPSAKAANVARSEGARKATPALAQTPPKAEERSEQKGVEKEAS